MIGRRWHRQANTLADVFPDELTEIQRRRRQLNLDYSALDQPVPEQSDQAKRQQEPSTKFGLVGLALSGGGIRSATFGLGFIQKLARDGILEKVDYLSTVSGGGYIGACLSSLLNDPALDKPYDPDQFPLRKDTGKAEPAALVHLRNGSNYLSPGGLIEKLRLPTLVLRGMLLNLMLFWPYIISAVILTKVAHYFDAFGHQSVLKTSFVLGAVFLVMVATFPFISMLFRRKFNWARRNAYELLQTASMGLAIAVIALVPLILVVDWLLLQPWGNFERESLPKWELWVYGPIGLLSLLIVVTASKSVSSVGKKIVLYTVGLLGPAALFGIYVILCVRFVDTPYLTSDFVGDLELESSGANLEVLGRISRLPAELGRKLHLSAGPADQELKFYYKHIIDPAAPCIEAGKSPPCVEEKWQVTRGTSPTDASHGTWHIERHSNLTDRLLIVGIDRNSPAELREWIWLGLMFFVPWLLNRLFLDVNITSPHGFYRDRLSRAFLIREDRSGPEGSLTGKVIRNDELKLSGLNREGTAAPYHLINAALNLEGSKDPGLRGRNAELFLFSKLYTGSERTGYCNTSDIEAVDGHLNLGTAIAISGAAAAPNMGGVTIRPLVFIMTMLNIRLGYWLPNPKRLPKAHWKIGHAGPAYLLSEAVGKVDAKQLHVNVSDGGHVENLGVYELLRRRCATIVAVDAEEDKSLSFSSLIQLIRNVSIDMGITITVDLDPIREGRAHTVVGEIRYDDGETGMLIYVKSSTTGDEPPYVLDYAAHENDFPHESTADQNFDEVQFEAYRALGEHVADTVPWPETWR